MREKGEVALGAPRPLELAVATDDGLVIALPYGLNTDWL